MPASRVSSARPPRWLPFLVLPLAALAGAALCQVPPREAVRRTTLRLPMPDGVHLATDLYLPPDGGRHPVVLVRTPYDKNGLVGVGEDAARRGYACVIQDTRGRFASEGENLPFIGDGWAGPRDGADTVAWIRAQNWCNGRIGTLGGSALGITQLKLAGTGTRDVAAQVVHVAAGREYHDIVYRGGVFRKAMGEDWLRATRHAPESLTIWRAHPTDDAYWRRRDLATRWGETHAAALHVGGWWDIFAQGTIDAFNGMQLRGGPGARGRQKLVMGPWTHGIFQERAGELSFRGARRPPHDLHDPWAWLDAHLRGTESPAARAPAVTYYVVGDVTDPAAPGNEWRTADRWPPFSHAPTPWYLQPDGGLAPSAPRAEPPRDRRSYRYNPADPVPTVGGPQLTLPSGPRNQAEVERRPDVLLFTSSPLAAPLEITGRVRARLWATSDAPDTDWVVRLCDVYPDGRSFNLCEGILRARYRRSLAKPELAPPGRPQQYEVDLWSISAVINRGHRLRVHVTSSCAPGYEANPNTGAPILPEGPPRVAVNTIFLGGSRASHLLLPIPPR